MNELSIEQIQFTRYLGLTIDENLKYNLHTRSTCTKISPYIFALKRIRYLISEKTAWNIYFAYIHPHLIYMNSIWGSTSANHLHSLKVIQNKAIKIIKQLPSLHSTMELYNEKILPLSLLKNFESCCYIFKISKNLIKSNIELIYVSEIHSRNTRNIRNMNFFSVRSRTRVAQNSVVQRGITLYNNLPNAIKLSASVVEFKHKLKRHLAQTLLRNTNTQN